MNTLIIGALSTLLLCTVAWAEDTPAQADPGVQRELERAQDELNRAAHEVADLSMQMYGPGEPGNHGHAMLGINVGDHDEPGLTTGVRVLSVSPGGPADAAGLCANDVITAINGKPLKGDAKESPRQQLLKVIRDARTDQSLALEFNRDGKPQRIEVTPTRRLPLAALPSSLPGMMFPGSPGDVDQLPHVSRGLGSAELLTLTPGLGRYFGTDSGLLVVRAPKDERLKLQEGDVLLDIDGRVPANAAHAFRIFASYRAGETMKLHIMRQQKKLELPIALPVDGARLGASRGGSWSDLGGELTAAAQHAAGMP